jgi:prepilin-type N-terminal cleavage/methylation domain-containing protein
MTRIHQVRRGFTLVELLVAMAVIIVLTGLALVVVPGILDQDRTTDGASLTRQFLMISKNRAGRDGLPRGLRLIVASDPNNPLKTSPFFVTELQYTESPPVLVPNPLAGATATPAFTPFDPFTAPYVAMFYTASNASPAPNVVGTGALSGQSCEIRNLTFDQAVQVVPFSIIALPTLGTWHRVTNIPSPILQSAFLPAGQIPGANTNLYTVQLTFDQYPDSVLGAASTAPATPPTPSWVSFHFGIYGAPRPLLGEPLLQLPKNICIDLTPGVSRPSANTTPLSPGPPPVYLDYDIVFAPSGQVIFRAEGQINLWVRDYTKVASMAPISFTPLTYNVAAFQTGGEQQIVALKTRSGSLGVFPVFWPDLTTGQYPIGDPYYFATLGANAP